MHDIYLSSLYSKNVQGVLDQLAMSCKGNVSKTK